MKLHRFTEYGIDRFGKYLDALSIDPALRVPQELLSDEACTVPVPSDLEIEHGSLSSRMQAAGYLDALFESVTGCDVERDVGLWAWLTLFYFDDLCPPDGHGHRKPGARARYIPESSNFQRYYRHLLAGPYRVFRAHRANPDRALVLLCGPVHKPGEIAEQLMARQEIITNPNAMQLATLIYFDSKTGSFKRGSAGSKPGSARRFADILNQFELTWDLRWIPAEKILAQLPPEFDRFRPKASVPA